MADIDYSIKGIEKFVNVDGTIKNVEVSRLTAPGENFISLVLKVDFDVEKDGVSKTFSTVAKRLPLSERKIMGESLHIQSMANEIKWYSEIVKLIKDFADEEGIQGIDFIPECHGSRYSLDPEKKEADKDSFLLLENLIPQGFENIDRYKGFSLSETKAILKKLALFHSIPLVMKFKRPELFNVLKDYLNNTLPKDFEPRAGPDKDKFGPPPGVKHPRALLLEIMINMPECSPYSDKLKLLSDKPQAPFSLGNIGAEPWNTILHNDFWVNNILISPQEDKEPLVKIVDYQMCTYGSYAKDLIFFLLTSVDNDVTKTYLDDLLRYYYEEFTSVLTETKVDFQLTFTAFLKEIQRVVIDKEFMHALFFSTVVFGTKDATEDIALKEFNLFEYMTKMIEKMNQQHKDKLIVLATESAHRNWI